MVHLLCAAFVAASCLLLSEKKQGNTALILQLCEDGDDVPCYVVIKCSNVMPSTDTEILPP